MAVPTISTITPDEGLTAGRTVSEITGTNFNLPPTPAATGRTTDPEPSVSVTIGGSECGTVHVLSATSLLVQTPIGDAGTADVVVTNLDEDGVAIPGETVTLSDGYTYRRPDLTTETTLQRVVRTLIIDMKRQVIENIAITAHTDYDSGSGTEYSLVEMSELPGIVLVGPRTRENRFQSTNENIYTARSTTPGDWDLHRPPLTVDLIFTAVGASDSTIELLNLQALFADYIQRNPYLYMDADPDDATAGQVGYELAWEGAGTPSVANAPNVSNLRHFTSEIVIRGVDIQPVDMVVDRTSTMVDYTPDIAEHVRAFISWTIEPYTPEE